MSSFTANCAHASGPYQHAGYGGYGGAGGASSASSFDSSAQWGNSGKPSFGSFGGGGFGGGGGGYGSGGNRMGGCSGTNGSMQMRVYDWQKEKLVPIKKDFYRESERVASLSREAVQKIRSEHEIKIVGGGNAPNPVISFEDAGFEPSLVQRLYGAGFETPSPIQLQAWPIALSGRDMIGIAETGSGKTLAFLLPAQVHICAQEKLRSDDGPIALILAPTRELVEQIREESVKFALRIRTGVAYGGAPRRAQMAQLRSGCEILAACPGRLIDFLERDIVNLRRVTYLVLDEADRMLDMGFEPQIRKIVSQIRPDRQTLMFSATWPKEVQGLARDLCKEDPIQVTIGSTDLKASHNVEQNVFVVTEMTKRQKLHDLLLGLQDKCKSSRIIIFVETKRNADLLTRELRQDGFPALCIHGDKEQEERKYVLSEFKTGSHPIMIATDVASRGLDVKDVRYVINYDMPGQIEDYVHRIGRTGRAGATGIAYSFMTTDKGRIARDLIKIMQEANQQVPNDLFQLASTSGGGGSGRGGRGSFGGQRRYGGGPSYGGGRGGGNGGSYYNSNQYDGSGNNSYGGRPY